MNLTYKIRLKGLQMRKAAQLIEDYEKSKYFDKNSKKLASMLSLFGHKVGEYSSFLSQNEA